MNNKSTFQEEAQRRNESKQGADGNGNFIYIRHFIVSTLNVLSRDDTNKNLCGFTMPQSSENSKIKLYKEQKTEQPEGFWEQCCT